MKHLAILLAGALLVGPAPALTTAGNTITLTDEERAACAAGGGCMVIPREAMVEALNKAHAIGAASRSCRATT